jgi:hypothetical protein
MNALAKENPVWPGSRQAGTPRWFGTSEYVMLCRVESWGSGTGAAEWWIFSFVGGRPVLERKDGWLTVS